jgi:Bacterial RNA polymerase, alpha chain C terminal domain
VSLLPFVGIIGLSVAFLFKLIVTNEYATWAAALARFFIRCSGLFCPSYQDQWQADLAYDQRVKGNSGLLQAAHCLLSAPRLALSSAKARRAPQRIGELGLSRRTLTILRTNGIATVSQLLSSREDELLSIRNLGFASLNEIKERLVATGSVKTD